MIDKDFIDDQWNVVPLEQATMYVVSEHNEDGLLIKKTIYRFNDAPTRKTNAGGIKKGSLKTAQLTMEEEIKIKKIHQDILEKRINKIKEDLVVKMDMKEEMNSKLLADPENEALQKELDRLESDIEFMIQDLVRTQKEIMGEALIAKNTGKLQTGSLIDAFNGPNGEKYVTYFLINAKENLKGWGVTPESIPRHIGSFKDMPFVITNEKFFPKSPYKEVYDHPDTKHFAHLGIVRAKEKNDMMQQASFQEEFRVGNIENVFKKENGDWFAFIKIKPKFANLQLPPLVSPAIFQLDRSEPADHITKWIGMHLTGLDEKPAYGNDALYKGSCFGDKETCLTKLSAKNTGIPACALKRFNKMRLNLAKIRLQYAVSLSTDNPEVQRKPVLCKKDGQLQACPQKEVIAGKTKPVVLLKN